MTVLSTLAVTFKVLPFDFSGNVTSISFPKASATSKSFLESFFKPF